MKKFVKRLLLPLMIICLMCMPVILTACGEAGADGTDGINGTNGTNGKSAYQIWLDNGHTGSESDFLNWLKGADGQDGSAVDKGDPGDDGKSAYQIWLDNGHIGTEADFLNWLKGEKGADGEDGDHGNDGNDGDSAYQIWLDNGHTGTETDFLNWLKGEEGADGSDGDDGKDGDDGDSAYQIWLDNGHTGTEAEFLEWLKGEKGEDGKDGDDGKDGEHGKSAFDLWLLHEHAQTYADQIGKTVEELTIDDFFDWLKDGSGNVEIVNPIVISSNVANGTITISPNVTTAMVTTEITVTITPAANYRLVEGSAKVNGVELTLVGGNVYSFIMPMRTATITASFELIPDVPTAPQNFTVVTGNGFATLTWDAATSNVGIIGYEVSSNGTDWVEADSDNEHTFTGLPNGITYIFSVRGYNVDNRGATASETGTPMATVPGAPVNLTATIPQPRYITLTWEAPDNGGEEITEYRLESDQYVEDWDYDYVNSFTTTTNTTIEIYAYSDYLYTFNVYAINSVGQSVAATVVTRSLMSPMEVQNINATAGDGEIAITWGAQLDDGPVDYYEVQVSTSYSPSDYEWVRADGIEHTFTTDIVNGTKYYVFVRAVNEHGTGPSNSIADPETDWVRPMSPNQRDIFVTQYDDSYGYITLYGTDDWNQINYGYEMVTIGRSIEIELYVSEGYSVENVIVKDSENNVIPFTSTDADENYKYYYFTMPASDITISVEYTKFTRYNISEGETTNGSFYTYTNEGFEGQYIRIVGADSISPNSRYRFLGDIYYTDTEGNNKTPLTLEGNGYYFTMPAFDIIIYVEFVEMGENERWVTNYASVSNMDFADGDGYTTEKIFNVGDTVTIVLSPDHGYGYYWEYELGTLKYSYGGNSYDLTDSGDGVTFTFIMPDADVTINATFKYVIQERRYVTDGTQDGNVQVNMYGSSFYPGETVWINVYSYDGWYIVEGSLKYNDQDVSFDPESNRHFFIMPDEDVVVTYEVGRVQAYNVYVDDSIYNNFSWYGNSDTGYEGLPFQFGINDGLYELVENSIRVTGPNNEEITVQFDGNTYWFIMPAHDVTITAEFEKRTAYSITIDESVPTGAIYIWDAEWDSEQQQDVGIEGQTIRFALQHELYTLVEGSLQINGGAVPVTEDPDNTNSYPVYIFTMPAGAVVITAQFTEPATTKYNTTIEEIYDMSDVYEWIKIIDTDTVEVFAFIGEDGFQIIQLEYIEYEGKMLADVTHLMQGEPMPGRQAFIFEIIGNKLSMNRSISMDDGATWMINAEQTITLTYDDKNGYYADAAVKRYTYMGIYLIDGTDEWMLVRTYGDDEISVQHSGTYTRDGNTITFSIPREDWEEPIIITGTIDGNTITVDFTMVKDEWPFNNFDESVLLMIFTLAE